MLPEDYKKRVQQLESEHRSKKALLAKEYAFSNSKIKEGDIFTDHIGSIKVDLIKCEYGSFGSLPSCIYEGIELKKDGTPTKKMNRRSAYQSNSINDDLKPLK